MTNKGRRYAPTQRETEKARRRNYRRDPEFSAFLAQELGMEATPASYRQALRRAYLELPRDMPVRRRPLRAAIRGLATVAALLVLASVSLLGANRVYPQLTESLPGLGMMFKTLNGTQEDPQPPTPVQVEAAPSEAEGTEDAAEAYGLPEFHPVTMRNTAGGQEEPGLSALQIQNAWSDGKSIYLDVAMDVYIGELPALPGENPTHYLCAFPRSNFSQLIDLQEDEYDAYTLADVLVNGEQAPECISYQGLGYAGQMPALWLAAEEIDTSQEIQHYTGLWVIAVPEAAQDSGTLTVSLTLPTVFQPQMGYDDEKISAAALGFSGEFPIEVDTDTPLELMGSITDNGVVLETMFYSPTNVEILLDIPFMGYYDYALLPSVYEEYQETPFGLYAVLAGPEDEVVYQGGLAHGREPQYHEGRQRQEFTGLSISAIAAPRERDILTLTLYQYDAEYLTGLAVGIGMPEEEVVNPVVAEFTIDLAEQAAYPSENYKEKGLPRLDAETSLTTQHHPDYQNGVYVRKYRAADGLWAQAEVELCVDPENPEMAEVSNLALYGYMGGEMVRAVYASEDLDLYTYNEDRGLDVYDSGDGYFWMQAGTKPQSQERYWTLHFAVHYPDWVGWDAYGPAETFDRLELVDTSTGQVLVEDVAQSYQQNLQEVLTGQAYRPTASPLASPSP